MSIVGRPRGTVGKASASEARGTGFEPPWLVQWSRWESRSLSLVGNGAGAVILLIDWKGSVFPRGTGRFLVKKGVHVASFRCLREERLSFQSRDLGLQYAKWDPVSLLTISAADARTAGLLAFPLAALRKSWSTKLRAERCARAPRFTLRTSCAAGMTRGTCSAAPSRICPQVLLRPASAL